MLNPDSKETKEMEKQEEMLKKAMVEEETKPAKPKS